MDKWIFFLPDAYWDWGVEGKGYLSHFWCQQQPFPLSAMAGGVWKANDKAGVIVVGG